MFHQKAVWFSAALATAAILTGLSPVLLPQTHLLSAIAHEVEISDDVGGTLHIEPNDTPRAGEEILAWVALRTEGGQAINLEDCDCQLAVYAQPKQADAAPLLSPELTAVEGDGVQGIPGAEFIFPSVGLYTLVMTGEPEQAADFSPFELAFDVTVAAGESVPAPASGSPAVLSPPEIPAESAAAEAISDTGQRPILFLLLGGIVIGAIAFLVIRRF